MKHVKKKINTKGKISIGSWITLNHFSIVEIMAEAGFDWLGVVSVADPLASCSVPA